MQILISSPPAPPLPASFSDFFRKNNNKKTDFEKKISRRQNHGKLPVGKKSRCIEMEGATCTCMFHALALYLPAFNTVQSRTHIERVCVCQSDDE